MRVLALLILLGGVAHAGDDASTVRLAQQSFNAGDYLNAALWTGPLTQDARIDRTVRAEALRLYGLSMFFLDRRPEAERALVEYLRLEPDAHLDPAQVPPEGIVFFEDVRARNAGVVARARPRVRRFHSPWVNLLPPWGQFQNGDATKGWVIGVAGFAFLAANVTTYALLSSMCSDADGTCTDPDGARTLRTVNLTTGVLFLATYAYGVIDGLAGYRAPDPERGTFAVTPTEGGAVVTFGWGF